MVTGKSEVQSLRPRMRAIIIGAGLVYIALFLN